MEKENQKKSKKRQLEGVVISNKMDKTVRVRVETKRTHPRYKKVIGYRKVYFAHTDRELEEGEKVTIRESKPFSKNVRWIVV
jgi:small subunit ribosomal protein S17